MYLNDFSFLEYAHASFSKTGREEINGAAREDTGTRSGLRAADEPHVVQRPTGGGQIWTDDNKGVCLTKRACIEYYDKI